MNKVILGKSYMINSIVKKPLLVAGLFCALALFTSYSQAQAGSSPQSYTLSSSHDVPVSSTPPITIRMRVIDTLPDFFPQGDDNPGGFLNNRVTSIDVDGAQFIHTDILPDGTIIRNFRAGHNGRGEVICENGKWQPRNLTGTCTKDITDCTGAPPLPIFGITHMSDALDWDPCGNDGEPCIIRQLQSVQTRAVEAFSNCGQDGSSSCLNLASFKRQNPTSSPASVGLEVYPTTTFQVSPESTAYLAYTACTDKIYRVVFFDHQKAGIQDASAEYLTIPTRCDMKNNINDFEESMDNHLAGAQGFDVDLACPPSDIYFCPEEDPVNPGTVLVPPSPVNASLGTAGMTPAPVCKPYTPPDRYNYCGPKHHNVEITPLTALNPFLCATFRGGSYVLLSFNRIYITPVFNYYTWRCKGTRGSNLCWAINL